MTGAAGFIGSHLAEKIVHLGNEVIGLDNFDDYYDPHQKERNVEWLQSSDAFHLFRGDIRDSAVLEAISSEWNVDAVVHLAATVGVRKSLEEPLRYIDVNVTGTATLLEWTAKQGIKKFILASSSSVYGNSRNFPLKESDSTDCPCSLYAASKKATEVMAHTYHDLYNISVSCLRFFTVYGPRVRPDMAPFKFIDLISRGLSIPRYGNGSSSRDYTFVSDIVQGIVGAIEANHGYEIFNLGTARSTTLMEFILTIEDLLGKKARIELLPDQLGDVKKTLASIEKARQHLSYNPKVSLRQGLHETIEWYESEFRS